MLPRTASDRLFLRKLNDFGIKLGLDKTFSLLEAFGQPQKKYLSILVAGTNGKGSVARTLAQVLTLAGYRVGLYTSPHLIDLRERIVINQRPVSRDVFRQTLRRLRNLVEASPCHLTPTFFEALTVMAFTIFAEKKVEVAVVEVGMGGRFDATNVLPASLSVITSVSLDHVQYLGPTLRDIAREKAGIIKTGRPVISARQRPEVISVVRKVARDNAAALLIHGRDFSAVLKGMDPERLIFDFFGEEALPGLTSRLLGRHQVENMALVVQACLSLRRMGLQIPEKALRVGLKTVVWPARLQIIRRQPLILLDGAHNPGGLQSLSFALKDLFPDLKFSLLSGMLKDKEWPEMVRMLLPWSQKVVFTGLKTPRALPPGVLAEYALRYRPGLKVTALPDTAAAWKMVRDSRENWVVCGSLYLAGEILKLAGKKVFCGRKLPARPG
ncbi:MAG TPA: folylpolyglutamate synthase/dihydrofolate synthase family protein [bacterium]|nr:folylpolyglutamate synthase/dihydrofolate synthase family protein [bacterium]